MEGKLTEISCMILCMPLGVTVRSQLLSSVFELGRFGHVSVNAVHRGSRYFEASFLPAHSFPIQNAEVFRRPEASAGDCESWWIDSRQAGGVPEDHDKGKFLEDTDA